MPPSNDSGAYCATIHVTHFVDITERPIANFSHFFPVFLGILVELYVVVQFFPFRFGAALAAPEHLTFDLVKESRHVDWVK